MKKQWVYILIAIVIVVVSAYALFSDTLDNQKETLIDTEKASLETLEENNAPEAEQEELVRAEKIQYNHDTSGLSANTIQEAVDEIHRSLQETSKKQESQGFNGSISSLQGTWKGVVYHVWDGKYTEVTSVNNTPITVTFTPSGDGSGTFASNPVNIFYPYEQINDKKNIGKITGKYHIVGETVFVDSFSPSGITTGLTAKIKRLSNGNIFIEETRVTPNGVIVLSPTS